MQDDYRLGAWLVQSQRGCVVHGDRVMHLKPKVMAVLDTLAEAGGKVVTRDDLFARIWPGQLISDAALTQCVAELRQALGDSARQPEFIETVPKVGFRLIPAVEPVTSETMDGFETPSVPGKARPSFRRTILLAGLLVVLTVALAWQFSGPEEPPGTATDAALTSVAVLPFADVSPDQQQKWIAESLTEQLISRLSRLEGLAVPGKTLSFTLEDGRADLKAVARQLGVDFIVEGSVFRVEQDLRINTRLVEVATGEIWWSYEWTPPLENFLEIQDILTEGVAIALSIELEVGELGLDPLGPSDVEAFWSWDRAVRALAADTREHWLEAMREIENAIERDPAWPQAWLWASFIYAMAEPRIGDIVHRDWAALREDALDRALDLAPQASEVLATLVNMYAEHSQYTAAEQVIARLGPLQSITDPLLLFHVGIARVHMGRVSEALPLLERAQLLDRDQFAHYKRMFGLALLLNGRTNDALAMYESAWGNNDVLRGVCSQQGVAAALVSDDPRLVRKWLMRAQEFNEAGKARIYQAMETYLDDRLAALAFLREAFNEPYDDVHDQLIAFWAAYHGDHELALDAMLRTPDSWFIWNPLLAPIRNEPAIRDMLRDLGLVAYWREHEWSDFCRPSAIPGEIECR